MSDKKCCVPGCTEGRGSHNVLHKFPNPSLESRRFNSWVYAIGGDILGLPNEQIYKYRRVCHKHFDQLFVNHATNRLTKIALPTLHMPNPLLLPKPTTAEQPLREVHNIMSPHLLPSTSKDPLLLPKPTSAERPLREVHNIMSPHLLPSTSKDPLLLPKPTSAERPLREVHNIMSPHLLPSTSKDPLLPKPTSAERPLREVHNIMSPHLLPSTSKDPLLLPKPTSAERPLREIHNIMSSTSKDRKMYKKRNVCKTPAEHKLHKKLILVKTQLSKYKNKSKKQSRAINMARNIMKNPSNIKIIQELPIPARLLTTLQFRESKKKNQGHRFNLQEKIMALAIYKQSPKCYRFLRKLLILPAPITLIKLVHEANIKPGINKKIFKQLENAVVNMKKPEEKLCILLFDEMALMPNIAFNEKKDRVSGFTTMNNAVSLQFADHAQVFMVRGLLKNYKQPISYSFSLAATKAPDLARQVKEIILEIQKTGLTVVATICDQGPNNRSALNILLTNSNSNLMREGKPAEKNVIIINKQEIVPLYDTPHLMKCVRNNLLTKNFKYNFGQGDKIAKWHHMELLHKENPGYKGIRLIPKLTDRHIIERKIAKMKVKYATQIFSETVAKNMGYLADKGILPEECKDTADLILFFDKLFDSLNGSYSKKEKQYAKPLLGTVKPNSVHHKFWSDAKNKLQNIKCIDNTGKEVHVPTLKNWAWTLNGLEILLKKLHLRYKVNSVWMRHLNQDPLENFFGAVRSHGCRNNNPTPEQFESAFTSLLINTLSGVQAPGGNCENDYCQSLYALIATTDYEPPTSVCNINEIPNIIFTPIEDKKDPQVRGPLEYVSGYFIKQMKMKVFKDCLTCKNIFINKEELEYIKYREYSDRRWLYSPTYEFLKLISEMQDIYNEISKKYLSIDNIKIFVKTVIFINIDFSFVRQCTVHCELLIDNLIGIANRFFIHNYCKNINKILTGKKDVDDNDDTFQVQAQKQYLKCFKRKLSK